MRRRPLRIRDQLRERLADSNYNLDTIRLGNDGIVYARLKSDPIKTKRGYRRIHRIGTLKDLTAS